MRLSKCLLVSVAVWLGWTGLTAGAASHQHINAGAFGSKPGAALYFVNGSGFAAEAGHVLAFTPTVTGPQAGLFSGGVTFTALALTSDFGGPAFDHAAPGAHLELVVESLNGPAGGRFGFWEGVDEEVGTELTFDISAGVTNGTHRFRLSETPGAPGDDPYGHVHGRVYTLSQAGLYEVGLRIVDTSANGVDAGPLHPPSELFRMYLQAGVSLGAITNLESGVQLTFAAPAGFAYQVEASAGVGAGAVWKPVGDPVAGDDLIHTVVQARGGAVMFFRLRRDP